MCTCGMFLTGCVGIPEKASPEAIGQESMVVGLIKVVSSGPYSRGYETQLRFFHLLNLATGERFRVNVQSAGKAFFVALNPGDYEVIRVQINEGPMMMESHVSLQFHVAPNETIYLGTWHFDVDTPRTQRMLRMNISPEQPHWENFTSLVRSKEKEIVKTSLPTTLKDEVRLFTVAPNPKISYFYR
ncbi:hypothetical protein [Candidatus Nitrospira salsa]